MLARESKVPPGFSGAVRVFYQGEVSGFHLTTLQLSGSSRFLITHTWWRIWIEHFSIRNNISDLVLKRATWTEIYFYIWFGQKPSWTQRTDEISLWSLEPHLDIKSMFFFFGSRIILQQNHPWDTIICEVLAESDIFWPGNILSTLLRSSIYC